MRDREGEGAWAAHSPSFQSLHLRHSSFSNPFLALPTSQLILQSFRCITYVTALPNEQSIFSKLSITSPTSKLILQPFRRFTYVTAHSPTLPLHHLRHSSFSNPSFASPTSLALHLRHLASRPWTTVCIYTLFSRSEKAYTFVEFADMVFLYGQANGNCREAEMSYRARKHISKNFSTVKGNRAIETSKLGPKVRTNCMDSLCGRIFAANMWEE